jgi:hypothetical protein
MKIIAPTSPSGDSIRVSPIRREDLGKVLIRCLPDGYTDIIAIVEFPSIEMAPKVSVELGRHLDIAFTTAPAVGMEEFDKLVTGR